MEPCIGKIARGRIGALGAALTFAASIFGCSSAGPLNSAAAASQAETTKTPADDPISRFQRRDAMVTMRDGQKLHTEIFEPLGNQDNLPIIFLRSNYSLDSWTGKPPTVFSFYLSALADQKYIFVLQEIRGRGRSEGQFVMMRPLRKRGDNRATDENTDAYDTIDWLLSNTQNNGRVGMLGGSYGGWLTMMAAIDPHPALKAICPQASPADMFIGDDFFHNGAFRLSYGFEYTAWMERNRDNVPFEPDVYDAYDWYLRLGSLANVARRLFATPTWNDFTKHPTYDAYWKARSLFPHLNEIRVPSLTVGGWYDQEDGFGPLEIFKSWARNDPHDWNFLIVGPWYHGGWIDIENGDRLGDLKFGSNTALYFNEEAMKSFFDFFLKDLGPRPPQVQLFETGANVWRELKEWTPGNIGRTKSLYLRSDGSLSFKPPPENEYPQAQAFVSNPKYPVPYRPRPVAGSFLGTPRPGRTVWRDWLVADQRFVHGRPDVLSWVTDPLTHDMALSGSIEAILYAATTGSDADWIVKLIDVYPDIDRNDPEMSGYQLMVSSEIFRGRFRNGLEKPAPIKPNTVLKYSFSLHDRFHRFNAGHRIMVQIQSSWFPLYDRNPQTYVNNIFEAKESNFRVSRHSVYHSARYPSKLEFRSIN